MKAILAMMGTKAVNLLWRYNAFTEGRRWLSIVLAIGLLGYVALAVIAPHVSEKFSDLLLLGSCLAFFLGHKQLRSQHVFWVLWLATLVALLSWGLMLLDHPEWAQTSPKVHRLTYWLLLIPIAYGLGGRQRTVVAIWLVALACLFLATCINGIGMQAFKNGVAGTRTDLNLLNPQHAAMYFSVTLLAAFAFLPRLLSQTRYRWLLAILWLVAVLFGFFAIVVTQTRAVWLGLGVALLAMSAFGFLLGTATQKTKFIVSCIVVVLVGLLIASQYNRFAARIGAEQQTVAAFIHGEDIPLDSAGIRLSFWRASLPWIEERPIVGWGIDGKKLIIQQSEEFPDWVRKRFSHMHNSFLDVLVNFGVLGLAVVAGLWFLLVRAAFRASRNGVIPADMLVFFLAFLVLWFVINCFESYMQFASGRFVFALISGGILSLIWRSELKLGSLEKAAATA